MKIKYITIIIILPFASILIMILCSIKEVRTRKTIENKLKQEIQSKRTIEISSITEFEWDRMYIFSPYTPIKYIYDDLGFNWNDVYNTNIDRREDINLLVFVKNNKVVQYLEYPRVFGDFKINKTNGFNQKEAIFEIKGDDKSIFVKSIIWNR